MSEVNWSKYKNIKQIYNDIKSVKIQGATNVAIATFEGLKIYLRGYISGDNEVKSEKPDEEVKNRKFSVEKLIADVEKEGFALAWARPNEPLAKNGMKYLMYYLRAWRLGVDGKNDESTRGNSVSTNVDNTYKSNKNLGEYDFTTVESKIIELCNEYLEVIKEAKKEIIKNSGEVFEEAKKFNNEIRGIMTHCHSSTAESVIVNYVNENPDVQVVCTETRPLYQGRTTAKNLVAAGVDTTMTVDSAAESMIMDKGTFPVDIIFLGSDEITMQGHAINKIGSWGIALASYTASNPIYVVTPLLKTDVSTVYEPPKIEMREAKELWEDAPKGLKLLNPSFEIIDNRFITGFITEVGVIKPNEIERVLAEKYEWLF